MLDCQLCACHFCLPTYFYCYIIIIFFCNVTCKKRLNFSSLEKTKGNSRRIIYFNIGHLYNSIMKNY